MGNGNRSVRFKVKPASYPLIKILLNSQGENEDDQLETEVAFPREFWLTLADNCKGVAHSMGLALGGRPLGAVFSRPSAGVPWPAFLSALWSIPVVASSEASGVTPSSGPRFTPPGPGFVPLWVCQGLHSFPAVGLLRLW